MVILETFLAVIGGIVIGLGLFESLYIAIQYSPIYGFITITYSILTGIFFFALSEIIKLLRDISTSLATDEEGESDESDEEDG